jgi:hypothetical protein
LLSDGWSLTRNLQHERIVRKRSQPVALPFKRTIQFSCGGVT